MATKEQWEGFLRHWYGEQVREVEHPCFHCLSREGVLFQFHSERMYLNSSGQADLHDAFDHTAMWRIGREPLVFVTQPYHLRHDTIRALLAYCDQHGLEMEIEELASIHNPGDCVPIVVWNRAVREKHYRHPASQAPKE